MYQRILIATDGTPLSNKAADHGIELATLAGAEVIVLTVVPRYPVSYIEGGMSIPVTTVGDVEKQWADAAQAVVDKVKGAAEARGVKAKAVTKRSDLVSESIIATAKKYQCDLIVMASHGRKGIKRVLMGSETTQVLTHSHIPVLVLR